MTGLETILLHIRQEAQGQADQLAAEAEKKAEAILQQAKKQAEELGEKARQKAAALAAESEKRAQSAAQLAAKQSILQEKQRLIGQVLDQAKQSLLALPDQAYFRLMLQMVEKYAETGKGEIKFSAQDLARLPEAFRQELSKIQPELKLSKQPAEIGGGFVLAYGGTELNCGFDALFLAAEDDMRDRAHEILFE